MTAKELAKATRALMVLMEVKLIPRDLCISLSKTLEQREQLRRKLTESLKARL